ncbi:serine hydrolase domain-containing protein [Nocardia caishijiensis]|uniref:CubicO group peptidase (Beta-lactamase class C family) n=1 Tax=Nocardia caishijiensis TaxID=184756 RepID=A0ABQ6YIS8_9NOCA|nr:serine hydrolase domain-containing protein [Nocardia caishijiensis]KAF0845700.1 CubicO group peptidase (beta-lactamase class C family) [Nocardia caishijiensis]
MSPAPSVHGDVAAGFGPVADAFRRNFTAHGEIGAAVAVYAGSEPLVDLWAGHRDRARVAAWERDTIVPVFSSSKGMSAFTIATAVSRGLLDYDAPVATYWPEFAAHGKDRITVRQLIDHQAGLSGLDRTVKLSELGDRESLADLLAAQKPRWEPGTRHGYHALTLGLYQSELLRRVDPAGRSLGRFFAEEIAAPVDADLFIGLPESESLDRVAQLSATKGLDILRYELADVPLRIGAEVYAKRGYSYAALTNPRPGAPARAARREFLGIEWPGMNGVGNARALARVYGAAAGRTGALPLGDDVLDLLAAPTVDSVPADDLVLHTKSRYHLGFRKSRGSFRFGSDKRAYGTTGLGGSFGFADPTTGLGFGYTMNRLGMAILDDVRSRNLRTAVLDCARRRA